MIHVLPHSSLSSNRRQLFECPARGSRAEGRYSTVCRPYCGLWRRKWRTRGHAGAPDLPSSGVRIMLLYATGSGYSLATPIWHKLQLHFQTNWND